ncbi:hypothetical protein [Mesorhizobium sp. M0767]|uniref:hypothetical protein n=1 Tax=unclassified Mesorhizobium TaxID=325217 RepID=UPI00333D4BBB
MAEEVGISRQRLYEWRDHRLHGNLKSRRRGRPQELMGPPSLRARSTCRHLRKRHRQRPGAGSGNWSRKSGNSSSISFFFAKPCGTSAKIIVGAALLAKRDLQGHRTGLSQGKFNIDRMCWLAVSVRS